jgi:RNA polymerase-interacting CarD/CdnL/TRCF family regulator
VPEETDRPEAAPRAEAEAMRAVLGTREVARISANNPQLKQNVASVARDLERQDAESEQERRALADAIGVWTEQLKAIRGLADR